ncbi:MAG: hypothetical protein IJJ44_07140 [Solobacterium sp.]|nr:hypothetical protein [Solobacterium sp.]
MDGIGSFLGDLFFYPAPMYVSPAVHGLQAVATMIFGYLLYWKDGPKKLFDHNIA